MHASLTSSPNTKTQARKLESVLFFDLLLYIPNLQVSNGFRVVQLYALKNYFCVAFLRSLVKTKIKSNQVMPST